MTEKLYYKDAYIKEFEAVVLSCDKTERRYDVVLDKTAFFPEEGGQYSDKGKICEAQVVDVKETDGIIHHYTNAPLEVGACVTGCIDFDERYEKMQCHSAEHVLSGLFHKHFGLDNVGFHLGKDDVTMDISAPLGDKEIVFIEALANEAVYANVEITTEFPTPSELSSMEYRAKLNLTENVRIVTIGEYDACACCAPHVNFTGEIGLVKFVDAVKHKGGSRIRMLAGKRAYEYVAQVMNEAACISALLSAPQSDIASEVKKLLDTKASLDYEIKKRGIAIAEITADSLSEKEENAVVYNPIFDMDSLRVFVNKAKEKCKGTIVALSGEEGAYKYVIYGESDDFQSIVKNANSALCGRGGGRAPMASGSFAATLDEIKNHFLK